MFTVVETREELAGLTEAQIEGAADEAESRDLPGQYVIPMGRSSASRGAFNVRAASARNSLTCNPADDCLPR